MPKFNRINMAVNFGLPLRSERFEGKDHLVAPVVLLVEGVHEGSDGAYYYPASEIAKYTDSWNGIPIPIFHPQENGQYVSANTPRHIEESSVGRLFNVQYDEDGTRLVGEIWIDVEKAKQISPAALETVQKGGKLEVSTGVFTDDDGISGEWNGEDFIATVSNFRPDHLALLPGGKGACSWEDGCGVRANVRSSARTPSFDGTESTSWAGVSKTFAAYRDAYYSSHGGRPDDVVSRVQDAPAAMKSWIASKTLLGEGSADNERDLLFFPVVNPKTGKLNEGALRAVIGGRGSQANIPEATKKSAQNKARSLLNKHFDADLELNADSSLVGRIKSMLKSMASAVGLKFQDDMSHEDLRERLQAALDELSGEAWSNYIRDVFDDTFVYEAAGREDVEISDVSGIRKLYRRGYSIDDAAKVTLADNPEEVIEKTEYIPVQNTAKKDDDNKTFSKEDIAMNRDELIKSLIECPHNTLAADDEEWLKTLSDERLKALSYVEKKEPDANADDGGKDPAETEPAKPATNDGDDAGKTEPKANDPDKPPTVDQYIANAPAEVQGVLRRAVARDRQVKDGLVKGLLANKRNKFTEEQLRAKDIDELEALAELAQVEVDYSLQGGAPMANEEDENPPEPIPVFNIEKKPDEQKEKKTA